MCHIINSDILKLKKICELYHKKEKNSLHSGKKFYFKKTGNNYGKNSEIHEMLFGAETEKPQKPV